jgi:hypothetical protein
VWGHLGSHVHQAMLRVMLCQLPLDVVVGANPKYFIFPLILVYWVICEPKITFGPSEVHALPVLRCRRAAWQTLVATINTVISLSSSSPPLLFSQKGLTWGLALYRVKLDEKC